MHWVRRPKGEKGKKDARTTLRLLHYCRLAKRKCFSVKIYQVTQEFPRHGLYGLTSQLQATVSVTVDIVETSGRRAIRD